MVKQLGLGPFLRTLEERLRALPQDDIRAALLTHAARLSAREREDFIEIFPETRGVKRASNQAVIDDTLLEDIDKFVEAIREGVYYEGWGWDDDVQDERAYGDESWVWEMDGLFAAAGDAFLRGDNKLACESYGRLLRAFLLEGEGETFSGPTSATEMVETDLVEAKARYLRALYETTPTKERASSLLEGLKTLCHVGGWVGLPAIVDAGRAPLRELERFLPEWMEELRAASKDQSFGRDAARLLIEAAELQGGVDGLASLSRTQGRDHPQAFLAWIRALLGSGRTTDAIDAAQEALHSLPALGETRGTIADELAELATGVGNPQMALDARTEAWRAGPTRRRLLNLVRDSRTLGCEEQILEAEADLIENSAARRKGSEGAAYNLRLACEVLLLSGRVSSAIRRTVAAQPVGWSRSDHPGPVVIPFLLAIATGGVLEDGLHLSALFELIDSSTEYHRFDLFEDDFPDVTPGSKEPERLRLSALLADRIRNHPPSEAERSKWLQTAKKVVERRTSAIVEAQHRRAYERVARLVVACGEAIETADRKRRGETFVAQVRARYPRHSAFRFEIDKAMRQSVLMPDPPRDRSKEWWSVREVSSK